MVTNNREQRLICIGPLIAIWLLWLSTGCQCTEVIVEDYSCYSSNSKINHNATIRPKNSIKVEVGSSKSVSCHLNPAYKLLATGAQFRKVYTNGRSEIVQSKVVDNFTIEAKLEEENLSKFRLDCQSKDKKQLCSRIVAFGKPPLNVENLNCISYNWDQLVCSFDLPQNPVQEPNEDYILYYKGINGVQLGDACESADGSCCGPRTKQSGQKCWEWNYSMTSLLEKFSQVLNLTIYSSNALGNRSFYYTIDQFERMIPDAVKTLETKVLSGKKVIVKFQLSHLMKIFPPGIVYRIQWETSFEKKYICDRLNHQPKWSGKQAITGLWPGHTYIIRVQLRSGANNLTDELWWSDPKEVTIKTLPSVPLRAPLTRENLFQTEVNNGTKKVIIYWKPLQERYSGAPQLRYRVLTVNLNSKEEVILLETNQSYAILENLSINQTYQFMVRPYNEEGSGPNSSVILVKRHEEQKRRIAFPIISYFEDENFVLVKLFKEDSTLKKESRNVTLVTCLQTNFDELSMICKSIYNWKVLPRFGETNLTANDLRVPISIRSLRFGIIESATKGIVWSTCRTELYQQALRTSFQNPEIQLTSNDSSSVSLIWIFTCQHWSHLPLSVSVYWSSVEEKLNSVQTLDVWPNHFVIGDLNPGTNYSFWIRVHFASGLKVFSSSLYFKTEKRNLGMVPVFFISSLAFFVIIVLLFILLYGKRKIYMLWKDWNLKINIPTGITSLDNRSTEFKEKKLSEYKSYSLHDKLLKLHSDTEPVTSKSYSETEENMDKLQKIAPSSFILENTTAPETDDLIPNEQEKLNLTEGATSIMTTTPLPFMGYVMATQDFPSGSADCEKELKSVNDDKINYSSIIAEGYVQRQEVPVVVPQFQFVDNSMVTSPGYCLLPDAVKLNESSVEDPVPQISTGYVMALSDLSTTSFKR